MIKSTPNRNNLISVICAGAMVSLTGGATAADAVESYLDLPLEDLLSLEVTSVSKKKQRISEAAAAVFVITQEDIRRSGVTSIPEALRMAPGIQVARIDANKWAISSRGFNTQFANKLLVLIDGRSVYTPSYSGVYWDVQDTLLEDIDRIEVIRGPGATLWGANAVNGVINIITKDAASTLGGLAVIGAGNEEKAFAGLRYGVALGEETHGRFFVKFNERDDSYAIDLERDTGDSWDALRAGFRIDGNLTPTDSWTLQGDIYNTDQNQTLQHLWKDPYDPANAGFAPTYDDANREEQFDSKGWNILARWNHLHNDGSDSSLQVYYDHTNRSETLLQQVQNTLDIDFQHHIKLMEKHDLVWGLGYRRIEDEYSNSYAASILPEDGGSDLYSAFVQDEIELSPNCLYLTLGSKFEHNEYTGHEIQPSARLLFTPNETNSYWASVSRAVRTPSRMENGSLFVAQIYPAIPGMLPFPLIYTTSGNEAFESESMIAYEVGYRTQPKENLSFDLALFYNDYDNLLTFERVVPDIPSPIPNDATFDNNMSMYSYGLELTTDWRLEPWWRLQANYSYVKLSGHLDDSLDDISVPTLEGSAPEHAISLRSSMDFSRDWTFDLWVSWTDKLRRTSLSVENETPAFTSVNARLAWSPTDEFEFWLSAQNLLDKRHVEFTAENLIPLTEVERSVYAGIRWKF